jgi:hypothetical protein
MNPLSPQLVSDGISSHAYRNLTNVSRPALSNDSKSNSTPVASIHFALRFGFISINLPCAFSSSDCVVSGKCLKSLYMSCPPKVLPFCKKRRHLRYISSAAAELVAMTSARILRLPAFIASIITLQASRNASPVMKMRSGSISFLRLIRTNVIIDSWQSATPIKKLLSKLSESLNLTRLKVRIWSSPRNSSANSAKPKSDYLTNLASSRSSRADRFDSRFSALSTFTSVSVTEYPRLPWDFRPAPFRFPPHEKILSFRVDMALNI